MPSSSNCTQTKRSEHNVTPNYRFPITGFCHLILDNHLPGFMLASRSIFSVDGVFGEIVDCQRSWLAQSRYFYARTATAHDGCI